MVGAGGFEDRPVMTWDEGTGYKDGFGRPGYREELELFVKAILEGVECHADLNDAWKDMLVLDAIEQSLKEGRSVELRAVD